MKRHVFKALAGAALLACSFVAGARAQDETTLTLAHFMSGRSSMHLQLLEPWAEQIAEASGGRLRVEIYPSMSLGGRPADLYRQVRDGAADMIVTVTGYTPGVFPRAEVFELPTVHAGSAEATTRGIQDVYDLISEDFEDVHPILIYVHGGNALHLVGPCVDDAAGLAGLKLRTPSRTGGWLIEALEAEPVGMPLPDLPPQLARGAVDGAFLPMEILPPYRLHEMTRCSMSTEGDARFGTLVFLFAMNKEVYEALPEDLKAVIDAHSGTYIAAEFGRIVDAAEQAGVDAQTASGGEVRILNAEASAAFVQAGEAVAQRWIAQSAELGFDGAALVSAARDAIALHTR